MNCLTFSGDIYGSNRTHSPSVKGHLRPLAGDFGTRPIVQPGVLDHVRSAARAPRDNGFFQHFQLSSTQHQKERNQ